MNLTTAAKWENQCEVGYQNISYVLCPICQIINTVKVFAFFLMKNNIDSNLLSFYFTSLIQLQGKKAQTYFYFIISIRFKKLHLTCNYKISWDVFIKPLIKRSQHRDVTKGKILVQPLLWWGRICPPGWNKVKIYMKI